MALRFTEEEFAELMQRRAKTKSTKRQTQKQPMNIAVPADAG